MSDPTVSVILPVYNGERYLRFAIESVLRQTFQDFELIVVDDGSSDSTSQIARDYGGRVSYIRQDNTGAAGAFNHGLRLASGRYISWLSHDDVFMPTKLESQITAISHLGSPAVCYTDIQTIDSDGNVVAERMLPEHGRAEAPRQVLTCGLIVLAAYSVLYDRRCIDQVGVYSEEWRYQQDVEMLLRFARHFPLVRVPGALMQVREHDKRGLYNKNFAREALRYYRAQLELIPLAELFPELEIGSNKADKAKAELWLAKNFAMRAYPLPILAFSYFLRALSASPHRSFLTACWLLRQYVTVMKVKTLGSVK